MTYRCNLQRPCAPIQRPCAPIHAAPMRSYPAPMRSYPAPMRSYPAPTRSYPRSAHALLSSAHALISTQRPRALMASAIYALIVSAPCARIVSAICALTAKYTSTLIVCAQMSKYRLLVFPSNPRRRPWLIKVRSRGHAQALKRALDHGPVHCVVVRKLV